MTEYIYASQIYQSVGDVEAVTALKNQLENNPQNGACKTTNKHPTNDAV